MSTITSATTKTREREAFPAVAPIPFGRLVRVELRKTVDSRAARWLLLAIAVMTVGALAIPLLFPDDVDQTVTSYLQFPAFGATRLLPILLLMALTVEWSQRTAVVTFTQEPRRSRVLAAKVVSGMEIAVAFTVIGALATWAAVAAAAGLGRDVSSDVGEDWPRYLGYVAFIFLLSLVGIAFGSLLHNTAAAIVTFFAAGAAGNLFSIGALKSVGHWVNTGETYGWVVEGDWSGHGWQILVSTLIWVALPLIFGLLRTLRREAH